MKWVRKNHHHQPLQRSSTTSSSSSSSSSFLSWISKLKQSVSAKTRTQSPNPSQNTKPKSKSLSAISSSSLPTTSSSGLSQLSPPPPHPPRISSVSDHLSFSPAVLDRMVSYAAPEEFPRHSYCGGDEDRRKLEGSEGTRRRRGGSFGSSRPGASEPDFLPFSSCRSDLGQSGSGNFVRRRDSDLEFAAETRLKPIQTAARDSGESDPDRARKSVGGKMKRRSKVKVYSPRVTAKSRAAKERRRLESFAVVKCSVDPQKDFRDSMVEMILENGIGRSEDLESLLACYLSLNSDEYHDIIVKVFQQVWFDLNPEQLDSESKRKDQKIRCGSYVIKR